MMDDRVSNRMGSPKGNRVQEETRAVDGARRLRHWNGNLVDTSNAFARSHVDTLNGRPYPVAWRRQGAEEAWTRAIGETDLWRQWSAPGTSCAAIRDEMLWQLERNFPLLEQEYAPEVLRSNQTHIANQVGVNLLYCLHKGTVTEATPALELLLANSDVDLSLPMSMVAPPYAAQYLHFGDVAMRHLKTPASNMRGHMFDGAFCFFAPRTDAPDRWRLELILISKREDRYSGQVTLAGETERDNTSLGQWMEWVLGAATGRLDNDCREAMHAVVSYVVKLFLYMGLKNARRVERNDHDDALKRAKGLGERKRDRLLKRTASLYNAILVGPETLPAQARPCGGGSAVAPHWRRGHFRMQPCGPGWQERKLIFVAPVLINAEQLQGGAPVPKGYCVDT
ncbi:hypothetical protein [Massilia orientalis]|uniref:Uncharacterized protein n=1 Tax=Massilia orientalis TaxID=3050128 RepID=A0ACC7MG62_9BURK|nr:hypothetical protein [Massilia sp. YIM B02787]